MPDVGEHSDGPKQIAMNFCPITPVSVLRTRLFFLGFLDASPVMACLFSVV